MKEKEDYSRELEAPSLSSAASSGISEVPVDSSGASSVPESSELASSWSGECLSNCSEL
jgi:hypothetical protein